MGFIILSTYLLLVRFVASFGSKSAFNTPFSLTVKALERSVLLPLPTTNIASSAGALYLPNTIWFF
jgi:hypothetical protein